MRIWLRAAALALVSIALWAGIVLGVALRGWGREAIAPPGDAMAFLEAASRQLNDAHAGNAVLLLLEDDRVVGGYDVSVGAPVGTRTVFQVASLSKWITAFGVMRLVEQGRLALDAPVEDYLTRWHLPPGDFDNAGVTVRRLLSHTAGLTDGSWHPRPSSGCGSRRPTSWASRSGAWASSSTRRTGPEATWSVTTE